MKKTIQIASIALILFTSTGMTVGFHYCGKLLQDVALFGSAEPCCAGMKMAKDCCHNESLEIKADNYNTTQLVSNLGFVPVLICEIAFPTLIFSAPLQNSIVNFIAHIDSDRPPTDTDIVIRVRSFLI